jgi:hypothetical protein
VVTSGTTPTGAVYDTDAIGGECAADGCAGVDGISTASGGVGAYFLAQGSGGIGLWADAGASATQAAALTGQVTVGTTAVNGSNMLTVNGEVIATAYNTSSSRRYKKDIHTLHGALGMVERLRGVTYAQKWDGKPQIGLIAEEVAKVLPQVVAYGRDGRVDGLDYSRLTAVLIEAAKGQQREIARQRAELSKQHGEFHRLARLEKQKDAQIARLRREIAQLEKAQQGMARLEARLARLEAHEQTSEAKLAGLARTQKKQVHDELARVQF